MLEIRKATIKDISFLKEMLYEAVFWRPSNDKPSFEESLSLKGVKEALINYGRPGDYGVVCEKDHQLVGAAWFRHYNDQEKIRGYIEPQTPVLVVAVHPVFRRQGIGLGMINTLLKDIKKTDINRVSLCVSKDNHALYLYQKLGFKVFQDIEDSYIMVFDISLS